MATYSANGSGTTGASSYTIILDVWENSYNIQNNTSNIGWSLKLKSTNYSFSGWSIPRSVAIDSATVYNDSGQISIGTNSTITLASGNKDITHNSDGKKTIYSSASINNIGAYYLPGNMSCGGNLELTNIPRQANVIDSTNFNDETNPSVYFNNAGGFSLKAYLEFGGTTIVRDNITNSSPYTFVLTTAERDLLRSKCTTSNSLAVRFVICTKLNGVDTWWSYVDRTMTIVNANPTFNNFTYLDTNSMVVAVTGSNQYLVKGLSNVRTVISSANKMVAIKGTTAKNYVADMDTLNASINYATTDLNIDLGILLNAGTKRLNVRAYDSRNNSTLIYKDILVYNYDKPVINATIQRLNNFEAQTTLKVSGTYEKLTINSVDKNVIATSGAVQYRYRETNGTWGTWTNLTTTVTASSGTFSCSNVILTLDNTKSYEFEVKCTDKLSTTTNPLNVSVGIPAFFVSDNKKAIGVNCIPPSDAVAGGIYSNGKEILDYDVISTW